MARESLDTMRLAICAVIRNEARYLREWIEFHRLMGVGRFHLYNRSEDDTLAILEPYMAAGIVELIDWPMLPPCQIQAYQHYIDSQQGKSRWTAFIDADEFLWSPRYQTVTEALESFPKEWPSVAVNWMCFGSSGKREREDAPVIERFTWRPSAEISSNHYVKAIVRMGRHFTMHDPHYANLPTFTPSGRLNSGSHSVPHEHGVLRINHYGCKSRQEWLERQLNGKPFGSGAPGPEECYDEIQGMDVDDREIQRYLPALKERLALP
jgi:hypothetical protein